MQGPLISWSRTPGPPLWQPHPPTGSSLPFSGDQPTSRSPPLFSPRPLTLGSVVRLEAKVTGMKEERCFCLAKPKAVTGPSSLPKLLVKPLEFFFPPVCAHPCDRAQRVTFHTAEGTAYPGRLLRLRVWGWRGWSHGEEPL